VCSSATASFTLMDQNRVLKPTRASACSPPPTRWAWATSTACTTGRKRLNHAQIDRWNIVATLNYLPADEEVAIVLARVPAMATDTGRALVRRWWRWPS
jgi:cobaltochelatase CobS